MDDLNRAGDLVPPADVQWHTLAPASLLRAIEVTADGLTAAEAAARLARFGPNRLPSRPPPAWWQILLRQFLSPLIYLLAVAMLVSLLVGDLSDAGFIAVVMALNTAVGGYQEWRAECGARALRQLLRVRAAVVRDGEAREIDAEQVVPGDVAWLESGNRVPADLRLLTAHGLETDEWAFTGESLPVLKDPGWQGAARTPVGATVGTWPLPGPRWCGVGARASLSPPGRPRRSAGWRSTPSRPPLPSRR